MGRSRSLCDCTIWIQMKTYSIMSIIHIQKHICSLHQSKEMPSALRQSVDIQQNNYSTSIVSAQRQPVRHDFYSERSTSYACIVPIPQPHAHTSTSPHTKWSGQASKTKGQYQENEQGRKVTYRHLETQLHVKRVESKILGVNMESIVRDEQNCSLKQTNKYYPRWPEMGPDRVQNQGQRPP